MLSRKLTVTPGRCRDIRGLPATSTAGPSRRNNKTLAPGEGPSGLRWSGASLAPVPPRSSVLPPGAGNEAKEALNAGLERANKGEKGYLERIVLDRNVDAPAVRRHDDGQGATFGTVRAPHGPRSLRVDPPMRNHPCPRPRGAPDRHRPRPPPVIPWCCRRPPCDRSSMKPRPYGPAAGTRGLVAWWPGGPAAGTPSHVTR